MSNFKSMEDGALQVLNLFKEQEAIEQQLLPRLPESLFVQYFLPLFRGEVKDPELEVDLRMKWYTIAGHAHGEVNIIDGRNEVMFTTPSIVYTKMFDPTKADVGASFKDILSLSNQINTGNSIRARQYLETNLLKKFEDMRIKGHRLTNEENRWLDIFKRYEKNESSTKDGNSVSGANKISNLTDDDLEDVDD